MLPVATSINTNSVLALKSRLYDNFMPGVNNGSFNTHAHQHVLASETKNYNNNSNNNNNNKNNWSAEDIKSNE